MTDVTNSDAQPKRQRSLSELAIRIITVMVLLPGTLYSVYAGGWLLFAVVLLTSVVAVLEFYALGTGRKVRGSTPIGIAMTAGVLLGIHLQNPTIWAGTLLGGAVLVLLEGLLLRPLNLRMNVLRGLTTFAAIAYMTIPLGLLMAIRALPLGFLWVIVVLSMTWSTDTFAYIGGRWFGRTPLAPKLSPKKTLEGAVVGWGMGVLFTLLFAWQGGVLTWGLLPLVVIGPVVAVLGDLLESTIKRAFRKKDSHLSHLNILPGHGGILDRCDALVVVTVLVYVYLIVTGIGTRVP